MIKNDTLTFIITVIGIFILGILLPWWIAPLWIMLITMVRKSSLTSGILIGAMSLGLVYGLVAVYFSMMDEAGIIQKTGELFGGISGLLLTFLSVIMASITGGLAGWFGSALNKTVRT